MQRYQSAVEGVVGEKREERGGLLVVGVGRGDG